MAVGGIRSGVAPAEPCWTAPVLRDVGLAGTFRTGTLQSQIDTFLFEAGHTYYIVVDGYSTSCGSYAFNINLIPPCVVFCPPGGIEEGEPPCVDQYHDIFNGGCPSTGWTPLLPDLSGCVTMCGRSCTFHFNGFDYRDTDWYAGAAVGGPVTVSVRAEFPVQGILICGTDCANLRYEIGIADPCGTLALTRDCAPDLNLWVWVGPAVFSGIPESDYVLEACGLREPGACCYASGHCLASSMDECTSIGGTWLGWGTLCEPSPCGADPYGACCLPGGACEVLVQSGCTQAGGRFVGAGADCDPNPCSPTPAQPATWGRIKSEFR